MAKNEYQKIIAEVLETRLIAYNPDLARALDSVKAGILLSQLLYWQGKGHAKNWVYKTIREMEQETALSRKEQDTAIKRCKGFGLIEVQLRGIPARRNFKLSIEKIIVLLKRWREKNNTDESRDVTMRL